MTDTRPARTWPLLLLALPAFVAIWSGWVGLGTLTGFGVIQPLPGIPGADHLRIDTRITLPIGVETYAAYALRVWLAGTANDRARSFARWSAVGSLILGAAGQIAYHLMVAAGITSAPWLITALVACLPVAVLGMGVALAHLQNAGEPPQTAGAEVQPEASAPALAERTLESVTALQARAAAAEDRPKVVTAAVREAIEAPPAKLLSNREQALAWREAGVKQAEIARRLGVAPQTVSGYFKPKTTQAT